MKCRLAIIAYLFCNCLSGQVELSKITKVSDRALFFAGEKGVDYHFNSRISPHGDCIKVAFGYIFVTWYRGGMDDRHVMLSRKKIGGDGWSTIEFPHQHIGYRGNPKKGDSHNTIAIGISEQDSTIHLIYDMHAYSKEEYGSNFFNYRVSKAGAAVAPDSKWRLDLFHPKRNYLKEDQNYNRATYPNFINSLDGKLFAIWRLGGSGNGNHSFAYYENGEWSETVQFNNGDQATVPEKYSIYGSFKHIDHRMIAGFSVRFRDFPNEKYRYNSGLYYAQSTEPTGKEKWMTIHGESFDLPLQAPDPLKIGSPISLVEGNVISSGASWTVTKSGAVHFLVTVSGTTIHYYKQKGDAEFMHTIGTPRGNLFAIEDRIYVLGLNEKDQPYILSSPEGKNDWKKEYIHTGTERYRHGNMCFKDDAIFYYLMEHKSGDTQPIYVLEFSI